MKQEEDTTTPEKTLAIQFPGSLRDYFVSKIIVSPEEYSVDSAEKLVGRTMPKWNEDFMGNLIFWAEFKAIVRGIEADAMIAEREKR